LEIYENGSKETVTDTSNTQEIKLNDADVKLLIESYETMCKETERLYNIKTLKELHDININLWTLKNSISKLVEHIEKN
jgi:hypothetical protein